MEKDLTEKANKILDLMITGAEKVGDVAQEQLPLLFQEYITYFIIEAIPVVSIGCLIVTVCIISKLYKLTKTKEGKEFLGDNPELTVPAVGFSAVIFIISFGCAIDSVKDIAKIIYAPKATIIEMVRSKK